MRIVLFSLLTCALGCSSSDEPDPASAGSGGASTGGRPPGGTGAASSGGGTGSGAAPATSGGGAGVPGGAASGGGGAAAGGAGAATGGTGSDGGTGSGGAPGGGTGAGGNVGLVITPPPGLDGLDLTLGGMNADLLPSQECLSKDSPVPACMSVVGVFGDTRFTDCTPFSLSAGSGLGSYNVSCDVEQGEETFSVSLGVGVARAGDAPSTFSFSRPPDEDEDTYAGFFYGGPAGVNGSLFFSVDEGRFTAETRTTGVTWIGPGSVSNVEKSRFIRGVFALVGTPTAACAPKVNSLPCKTVRLRGVFTARVQFDAG